MNLLKRKWLMAAVTVVTSLALVTGGAVAADRTDSLFARIRSVYDVVGAWHKDGADLDKFVSGAIKGGLEALGDPHTNYYSPEDYQGFLDSLNGSFSGIGAYLEQDAQYVVIASPIKNTPAAKAGLKAGDRLLEADGVSLVGATTEKAVSLIRGNAGTSVTLKIERPSESRTFTVTIMREQINIPEVDSKMLDNKVGYIELSSFGDDAVKDFYAALNGLKAEGAQALVLDLRNNGGGYLDAAVSIGSAFVPKDEVIVWEVLKGGEKKALRSTGQNASLPVIVLVNKGSASASEILAGAIQDYGGTLVGTTTYGKGTVQQILSLKGGDGMKVTIAEYLTPKERHVHGIGLTPNHVLEVDPDSDRRKPLALSRTLRLGMSGDDVKALQERLADLGYPNEANGTYWGLTAKAVQDFARKNELTAEGEVDLGFVEVLNTQLAKLQKESTGKDLQLEKAVELIQAQIK